MIIKPRIRGFVCLTAHPAGCAAHVRQQIELVRSRGTIAGGPKKVLVIGASTGYGLASRITAAFGCGADTFGLFFEKEPDERRPGTAGWYNNAAFEKEAHAAGLYAQGINGDAFSDEIKAETIATLKKEMGPLDLVVYSLASPRRTHPKTGEVFRSTLKPIGAAYDGKTLDTDKKIVKPIHIEPATQEDIDGTVAVMGGEDWEMWIDALQQNGLLAPGCKTVSYTYIGTKLTWPIYWEGTIGKAKEDLDRTSVRLNQKLADIGGKSYVAVMKALVTQASSAIPVVPLYISLLYRIMKEKGIHEGCIEQAQRLFAERLYQDSDLKLDEENRIRLDDWEMRDDVQAEIDRLWPQVKTENLAEITDFAGYQEEFLKLFGFGLDGVDYDADIDPRRIP